MYESEANQVVLPGTEIPPEMLARFTESRKTVTKRTLIPWGEHCTECVWPTCYTTCDLYSPRLDRRCQRFVQGMVRIDHPETLNSYLLKISFKRWAKLWSVATLRLHSLAAADRAERRDFRVANYIHLVPWNALQRTISLKRYSMKKRETMRGSRNNERPNCLLFECYNPNGNSVSTTLTVRRDDSPIHFQALLLMQPGFNRQSFPVVDIERVVDLSTPFHIDLTPNNVPEGLTLYFGAMDFVIDKAFDHIATPSGPRLCKCVVWDLDNTIWDGILVEDGLDGIRLKPGIQEILRRLDERGILMSVVSKNNHDDAMMVLRHFGIDEYFLFPQVSWNPKSEGIRQIAASLNLGLDSLLFIDDSSFEREQVESVCPDVMVLDAAQYEDILDRPDCQLPVTGESRGRRLFYRDQQIRDQAQKDFHGEYRKFLRGCNLRLRVSPMTQANLERVHELTQRTNQMNFSGNRYSREQLRDFLNETGLDTYVLDCEDRFGSYGAIGFCLVLRSEGRMTDLMFSCRIQGKRVEHAFVSHLIRKYREHKPSDFFVSYRKTNKNAGPGKVFEDLGFQLLEDVGGLSRLVFRQAMDLPDDDIVHIEDTTAHRVPILS